MDNQARKPRVFIGSSKEGEPELTFISESLKPHADVVPWTHPSIFRPPKFTLQALLEAARNFDFAVFVFRADDLQISRDAEQAVPRDNVVFEAGLFMSHLGIDRTFIVAPRQGVKILSDFSGLNLSSYDVPEDRAMLKDAMTTVRRDIIRSIKELGPRDSGPRRPSVGPPAEMILSAVLLDVVRRPAAVNILNIALDMEVTWPMVRDGIISDRAVKNVAWRSLMIDPDSREIKSMAGDYVNPRTARNQQFSLIQTCRERAEDLKARGIEFECRAYSKPPVLHGFLIDRQELLMSLCGVKAGKLKFGSSPYWRFYKYGETDCLAAFEDWFNYQWNSGKPVWPPA
jgi:Predicted nucleotide-binding protein containing TIR-like domain